MKTLLVLATFALCITTGLSALPPAEVTELQREVLEAERQRIDALVHDDHAVLERMLTEDLNYTHSNGTADSKSIFMESLTSGRLKYRSLEHSQQQVRLYGETAILTGTSKVHAIANGVEIRPLLRFTMVYVKQASSWRLATWHSTRLQE